MEPFDDLEVGVECGARGDHPVGALSLTRRGRVDDQRSTLARRQHRADPREIDPRRDHLCLRHPPDRVEAPDDLDPRLLAVAELARILAADIGAEVVHHAPLPQRAQDRELQRLRDERQPEGEVEDVRSRQQVPERTPLAALPPEQAPLEVERQVGLREQRVAVEDDEPGIDPSPSERLDVRPRDTGGVDRADGDTERRSVRAERPLVDTAHRTVGTNPPPTGDGFAATMSEGGSASPPWGGLDRSEGPAHSTPACVSPAARVQTLPRVCTAGITRPTPPDRST